MSSRPSLPPALASRRRAVSRAWRRHVLARRRSLAAAFAGVAVLVALRALAAPPPPTVEVAVAAHDLAAGHRLAAGDLVETPFPAELAPTGAGAAAGAVLAAPVRAGEPVTDVRVVGADLSAAHPGLAVLPLRLPDPDVVALLAAGDRLDVSAVDPETGATRSVAEDVLVLAIPPAGEAGSVLTGRLVVVGVDPTDAPALAGSAVRDFLSVAYAR